MRVCGALATGADGLLRRGREACISSRRTDLLVLWFGLLAAVAAAPLCVPTAIHALVPALAALAVAPPARAARRVHKSLRVHGRLVTPTLCRRQA
ncbi:hypothetical protein DFP73DRAFT_560960 [Morchella snyderi]|nr:hypothetical protein DFP73DRAFT_560960 [Morchella snyderi]